MSATRARSILVGILVGFLVAPLAPASGASTGRVKDINPGGDSHPAYLAVMKVGTKRLVFFQADDGTSGRELWRSDGTAAGTKRVKDINPGAGHSSPFRLTVMKVGTKPFLFFRADDGASGRELWRSDGTAAGTKRVKDIDPGAGHSEPNGLTVMKIGSKPFLFFQANDGSSGYELWRTDGTAAGTKRVKDINTGPGDSSPYGFTVMKVGTKRLMFFGADDGSSGEELWRTDGTAAGTKRVKDVNPGAGDSFPYGFTVMKLGTKRFLFFSADDGTSGYELWRTDASAAGTKRVKDINPGGDGSDMSDPILMKTGTKRFLFFGADDGTSGEELWRSDGTSAGTKRVKDINPGAGTSHVDRFIVMKVGDKPILFFGAMDSSSGYELWRSDGTGSGTRRVKDIDPGPENSMPDVLTVVKVGTKPFLFFRADDGTSGIELWRTDGTAAGTKRVKDINPGGGSSSPDYLAVMKIGTRRTLFFGADDGASGTELWQHRP